MWRRERRSVAGRETKKERSAVLDLSFDRLLTGGRRTMQIVLSCSRSQLSFSSVLTAVEGKMERERERKRAEARQSEKAPNAPSPPIHTHTHARTHTHTHTHFKQTMRTCNAPLVIIQPIQKTKDSFLLPPLKTAIASVLSHSLSSSSFDSALLCSDTGAAAAKQV